MKRFILSLCRKIASVPYLIVFHHYATNPEWYASVCAHTVLHMCVHLHFHHILWLCFFLQTLIYRPKDTTQIEVEVRKRGLSEMYTYMFLFMWMYLCHASDGHSSRKDPPCYPLTQSRL